MPAWGTCAFLKSPLLTQSVSGQTSCWPGLTALTPACLLAPLPGKWPALPVPACSSWPMLSTLCNCFTVHPPSTGECAPQLEE